MMPTHGRGGRRALAAAAGVAALLMLNVTGVLADPGGPLRESSAEVMPLWLDRGPISSGSVGVTNAPAATWAMKETPLYFGLLTLQNPWPIPVTVEGVTPIDPTQTLVVDAVYLARPGAPATGLSFAGSIDLPAGTSIDQIATPLPATLEPGQGATPSDGSVYLLVHGSDRGDFGFSALEVRYRVGPMTFRVVHHVFLRGCLGPLAEGEHCTNQDVTG